MELFILLSHRKTMSETEINKIISQLPDMMLGQHKDLSDALQGKGEHFIQVMQASLSAQQNPDDVKTIDYPLFIQTLIKQMNDNGSFQDATNVENLQSAFRTLLMSHVISSMQSPTLSNKAKYEMAYYNLELLTTLKNVYNIQAIEDYDNVLAILQGYKERYGPKTKTDTFNNKHFLCSFSHSQQKIFLREIREHKYTTTPTKLFEFLNGNNASVFTINKEKLHHISYLIHRLCKDEKPFLKLSSTGAFFKHFEQAISNNEKTMGKINMAEARRQVMNADYKKSSVKQEVDKIIEALKK